MKYLKCTLVAVAVLAMMTTSQKLSANGLTDPGFEDPSKYTTDGPPFIGFWEGFSGSTNASSIHDTTMPRTGTGHSTISILGDDNSFAGLFQDVAAVPGQLIDGGFWHKTPDTAPLGIATELRIEWHGDSGEISRDTNDGVIPGVDYSWVPISGVAPAGTNAARLVYAIQTFGGEPDGGASSTGTVYLDDAVLRVVPEPALLALLGMAGLAIVSIRRRK